MFHAAREQNKFANLGNPKTIWAISAVHAQNEPLIKVHDDLVERIKPGDKLIYLGNYAGYGPSTVETINEILAFRRLVLSKPGMMPHDFIYLRGRQEEMFDKLLQLQFAPNPTDVLLWMLGNGLSGTLYSYGISPHDGIHACRAGIMEITKWVDKIRKALRRHPGHEMFTTQLKQAAYTTTESRYPMLFVHAGLDQEKPLAHQGDSFWWAADKFESLAEPYNPFKKILRGYDPEHKGMRMNCITATLDGGCGFGGKLVCAGLDSSGEVLDILES